jgi:gamma-glutamylcyclotransferase (GGCT)/AIG2-like uncharacterized protein YtfP
MFEIPDEETLKSLDSYEGYDPEYLEQSLYIRREVIIDECPCYIYEYNGQQGGRPTITTGDWLKAA